MRFFKQRVISNENNFYLQNYLQNLSAKNKSSHTIKNYRADIEKFFYWIEHHKKISITKVQGDTITEYKDFLMTGGQVFQRLNHAQSKAEFLLWIGLYIQQAFFKPTGPKKLLLFQNPMSVASRRRHLSSLKNFFEYLKEANEDKNKKFLRNPVKSKIHGITLKDVDVENTKMISAQEFNKVYEIAFKTRDRLILDLMYHGGLRLSELCFIKKLDFEIENKAIRFIRKGGSRHLLYINKSELIFKNFLFIIAQDNSPSEYLFHNNQGEPYNPKTIYNQIMKLLKKANVRSEITPHSFRKACATNLYIKSKDLLLVRDYLNHADAKVTQTYIELNNT